MTFFAGIRGAVDSIKAACRVATTANITLSGAQTIDSVSAVAGDRVLVLHQTTPAQNGVYVVAAGAWARAVDFSGAVSSGVSVYVREGTTLGGKSFRLTTNNPIVLGTTALVFVVTEVNSPWDFLLKDELLNNPVAARYIAATGNDDTGNGSTTSPWRNIQRAIAAIPPGCLGLYEIRALDAGPFPADVSIIDLGVAPQQYLYINLVGAGTTILSLLSATASSVANPTGGTKGNRLLYSGVGAHGAITNGSHWVRTVSTFGATTFTTGVTVDGANSPSPDLTIASGVDVTTQGYTAIDLVPYVSELVVTAPNVNYFAFTVNDTSNVFLYVTGFFTTVDYVFFQGAVTVLGSAFNGTGEVNVLHPFQTAFDLYTASPFRVSGRGRDTITISSGLFGQCTFVGVFGGCGFTCRTTTSPKITLGYNTNGGPRQEAALDQTIDFEGAGGICITMYGGSMRFGNGGSTTIDGAASFLDAHDGASIRGSTTGINGSTSGICVTIDSGTQARGFGSFGTAPRLRNSTTPGDDVVVGAAGTVSFATLPQTDLTELVRVT